ncbi:hypothetical protein IE53DRAFT_388761 [Violaceomyces palustris]|uniref:Uncharacterized protein n=1 Tax=Violaceomyces palustris TaxID=1673888 RepID=A0ACD0NTB9_9BASI|nr:hypothetical protein IE53DRAFT_388761 [Violaceomyces palustris]
MGAATSKQSEPTTTRPQSDPYDKQANHLQFGRSLLNHLDKKSLAAATSGGENGGAENVAQIDAGVQEKIRSELERLRKEEEDVRRQIQEALERENAEIESSQPGGKNKNSNILKAELDQVRARIERHKSVKDLSSLHPGLDKAREAVVKCYRERPDRSLDCWKETQAFKEAVASAEKAFIASCS